MAPFDGLLPSFNPIDEVVRIVLPLDDGSPLDLSPIWAELSRRPTALLNPMDLFFEIQRPEYFKKARFDGPLGDPGWFGPDSAAWYVHTHTPSVVVGMVNTAIIDILHQDIQYAVYDHSKLVGRCPNGTVRSGTFSKDGLMVRAGHTFSFFTGVVYGSTETAESLCQTVKAMHHRVKGTRPDGKAYDADEPEFFRWTYATVVDGLAGAHRRYHPNPLRGSDLDQFYREYSRIGRPSAAPTCRRPGLNAVVCSPNHRRRRRSGSTTTTSSICSCSTPGAEPAASDLRLRLLGDHGHDARTGPDSGRLPPTQSSGPPGISAHRTGPAERAAAARGDP